MPDTAATIRASIARIRASLAAEPPNAPAAIAYRLALKRREAELAAIEGRA